MTRATATFKINVVDGSARPAWRNSMVQWQWKQLAGTAEFSGVTPNANPGGSYPNRLDAWNGFCAIGSAVYIAGMGGHSDYAGNEAYKLDLGSASPTWVILRQPTPAALLLNDVPYYADGRPNSAHLYYSLHGIGNELIRVMNGSHWPLGQSGDNECVAFDLGTNDWRAEGTYEDSPQNSHGCAICMDQRDGTIYYTGSSALHRRNPTTGVWTQLATWPQNGSAVLSRASAVDTARNRVVFFGDAYRTGTNGGFVYDIGTGSLTTISFSGVAASTITAAAGHGANYEPALDRFILKTDVGAALYSIHPTTWEVSSQATSGGSSMADAFNAVWTKFIRVPNLGGYFYQPRHSSVGWFLATE